MSEGRSDRRGYGLIVVGHVAPSPRGRALGRPGQEGTRFLWTNSEAEQYGWTCRNERSSKSCLSVKRNYVVLRCIKHMQGGYVVLRCKMKLHEESMLSNIHNQTHNLSLRV
jgi:hypothetical protein